MLAALAALALIPSASAMSWTPPTKPVFHCPVTEPGDGGLEGVVKDAAHEATSTGCAFVDIAKAGVGVAYDAAVRQVDIIVGFIGPVVDGTQQNVCDTVYGPPPHTTDPGCSEVTVNLQMSA